MATIQLPDESSLERLFLELFGTKPAVRPLERAVLEPRTSVAGEYMGDGYRLLAVAELALANAVGAAMTLIPVTEAEQNTKQRIMSETLYGNFCEVLNIMGGMISVRNASRLVLKRVVAPPSPWPPELVSAIAQPAAARYFSVRIGKYGEGALGCFITAANV